MVAIFIQDSFRQLTTAMVAVSVSAKLSVSLVAVPDQKCAHLLFEGG